MLLPWHLSALHLPTSTGIAKTWEGNDTANARMLAAHEKAFACYDSCPEYERYRTSVFLVCSLHTRTYMKWIWQLELSVRETSEKITEWFYHGSYILHEGRSWSWCHIILARVQLEYHCVWSFLHSLKGRYISTRRRAPSWQHNCGLPENMGTIDWLPAADDMQLSSEEFLPQKVHPVPQFSHS